MIWILYAYADAEAVAYNQHVALGLLLAAKDPLFGFLPFTYI